jgi:hypothetical protein
MIGANLSLLELFTRAILKNNMKLWENQAFEKKLSLKF